MYRCGPLCFTLWTNGLTPVSYTHLTQHLPFRLGFSPRTVSAQLANIAKTRPDENGMPVPCETWDHALLMCEAHNTAGDTFPMQLEMKRMAPGCTNTCLLYTSRGV